MAADSQSEFDQTLLQAADGGPAALERFFIEFLSHKFTVPLRHQKEQLSYTPSYPNDLVSVLGVQDKERVIVPSFSQPQFLDEWIGIALESRSYTGEALLKLIPDGWWLCINPGQEIEKELSPWEISRLKAGILNDPDTMAELVAEQAEVFKAEQTNFRELAQQELSELRAKLMQTAKTEAKIESLTLTCAEQTTDSGNPELTYHLGVCLAACSEEMARRIKEKLENLCHQNMIGAERVKVILIPASRHSRSIASASIGVKPFYMR
ncbi:MAG: hypothetical protein K1X79_10590 [Oligoflexia bacterium]|nr:hypothetical protein [Oligoflexia bacterium]